MKETLRAAAFFTQAGGLKKEGDTHTAQGMVVKGGKVVEHPSCAGEGGHAWTPR